MKSLFTLVFITLFNINTQAVADDKSIQLPGHCSKRISSKVEISANFNHCLIKEYSYGENFCEGSVTFDNAFFGGNTCYKEDGDMGYSCTQMGVGADKVLFKVKKNGTIKIVKIYGNEYGGSDSQYSDFQSILYRKLILRMKFKIKNGKIFVIRNLKKRELNCN
jgi:hypothetical protein